MIKSLKKLFGRLCCYFDHHTPVHITMVTEVCNISICKHCRSLLSGIPGWKYNINIPVQGEMLDHLKVMGYDIPGMMEHCNKKLDELEK